MKRSNKKTKLVEGFISFTSVVVIAGSVIGVYTAQQKHQQVFDEQIVQKAGKQKTSVEKRVEKERPSVESINNSLDAKENVQNTKSDAVETSQAKTAQSDEAY